MQDLNENVNSLPITNNTLLQIIDQTWEIKESKAFLKAMSDNIQRVVTNFLQTGNDASIALETEPSLYNYLLAYEWPRLAKSFMFLWRDILFEQQKAYLLVLEGSVKIEEANILKLEARKTIQEAANELIHFIKNEEEKIKASKNGAQKHIEKWQLQLNPYPTYSQQIKAVEEQCQYLFDRYELLEKSILDFRYFEKKIEEAIFQCMTEVANIKKLSIKIGDFILTNLLEDTTELLRFIDEKIDGIFIINHLYNLREELEKALGALPVKNQFPVSTNKGRILYKEINLQFSIRRWLEAEILPLLYDIWETTKNTGNGIKMSLLGIRSQASLLVNESKKSLQTEDICQPLTDFTERIEGYEKHLEKLSAKVLQLLEENFQVSSIYKLDQEFLPVRLQSTVQQFQLGENKKWIAVTNWWKKQVQYFRQFTASVVAEESLSVSEKIVRFVQNRTISEGHQHYASIFLAKGYIGESFWTGRKSELERMNELVTQWQKNYRGAVMVSGQRFSGKSLFCALVEKRFFRDDCIYLLPNIEVKLEGRKFETTYNLAVALEFIRKYSINDRRLIVLDDLELWNDPTFPLSRNIRALEKHLDRYSQQTFFLITMSNWLRSRLEKVYNIEKVFQAEINLDVMSLAEVREAIVIRHGATNKPLLDAKGEEINPQQLQKIIRRIYKSSEGNIGEALREWISATDSNKDQEIILAPKKIYKLPTFLNPDSAILLAAIMMEKRTFEYRLIKMFGDSFKDRFGNILQRLMSIGFLKRYPDGSLEINEVLVNELGKLLEENGYLKFHK